MKINVIISNTRLELSISSIWPRLPTISHMIKVTILYSFLVWVKHPPIHHGNPEMIWMAFSVIKWNPILTRHAFIDEYRSCKYSSSNRGRIDTISWLLRSEELASYTDSGSFFWVVDRSRLIQWEEFVERAVRTDLYCTIFYIREYFASVCSRRCRPLIPVIGLI